MKKVWKLLMLVSFIFLLISCGKKKEEKPLVMGLVPIANSEKLIEDTAPLHKMLGDEIGRPVEGFIATNYIGIVEALGTGTIDFALIPPFAYILANKKNGTEALLTSINKHDEPGYYSVLLVRTDSGIEKVEDLKGKKVAFVDPSSTSGYIFPAVILMDHGINIDQDITYQFAGGHDKALQLLINGDVDAIGTYESAITKFAKEFPEVTEKVKILQEADDIFINALMEEGLYGKVDQAFVTLLPVKTVGVMGDQRTYEYVAAIRSVNTIDFMTATWSKLPYEFLGNVANKIINNVNGINRIVYDISSKPAATIEWE